MKLNPLDIQQQQFSVRFRGFDTQEVESFLETVANEMEDLLKINKELREEMERKETRIWEYQNMEKTLKETLIMAQTTAEETKKNAQKLADDLKTNARRAADDSKHNAQKEADSIISRAREQAEKIIAETESQLTMMQEELKALKREKMACKQELKSHLETHLRILESFSEKETGEPEGKPAEES